MKLKEKRIKWVRRKQPCDCDKIIDFSMPMNKDKQYDDVNLDDSITSEDLDCMCHSKKSVPYIDQPGYGPYDITTAGKCTRDE